MGRLTDRQEWIALAHCVEPADAVVGRLLAELGPTELLRRISADATGLRHGEGLAAGQWRNLSDREREEFYRHIQVCLSQRRPRTTFRDAGR